MGKSGSILRPIFTCPPSLRALRLYNARFPPLPKQDNLSQSRGARRGKQQRGAGTGRGNRASSTSGRARGDVGVGKEKGLDDGPSGLPAIEAMSAGPSLVKRRLRFLGDGGRVPASHGPCPWHTDQPPPSPPPGRGKCAERFPTRRDGTGVAGEELFRFVRGPTLTKGGVR
jgi:hypothetical protein